MEDLPLHLKYRPSTFAEFYGNDTTVESLIHTLANTKRKVRSFLLYGPSGCGKTTLARIIKNELNCSDRDFMEYNMANTRGIDTIREIITQSVFSPMSGTVKIYLIDECHKLTGDAQNSLLKILEETPDHIRFILCTTEPEKLLTTIKNRCTPFQVQPLVTPKLVALLKDINAKEGLNIQFPSLKEIAKVAMGSPRHALVLLEQVSNLDDKSEENVKRVVTSGLIDEAKTIELCRALLKKDWPEVAGLLKGITAEPEQVRYAVLGYFSTVLLSRGDQGVAKTMSVFTDSFMYSGKAGLILACYISCN